MQENYELVQKGFRILHPQMAGYIGREMNRVYHKAWWQEVLSALSDQARDLPDTSDYMTQIDSLDVANCLRLIDRRWNEVFRQKLSIDYRTWSKELMGVRNTISHVGQQDLQSGYAERALDTMALLSEGFADDAGITEEIRKLYRTVRYGSADGTAAVSRVSTPSEAGKRKSGAAVLTSSVGRNLPSWREVMQPHPDVAEGRYQKAEFVANLAEVAKGKSAYEYRDPVEFFRRTYVTEGLSGLLVDCLRRLSGTGGEPVIQLKTAFGGGKTHSMLALYHMARGGITPDNAPGLRGVLERAGLKSFTRANVAVLVGFDMDPTHTKKPSNLPGRTVNTIWGEMAYQLVTSAEKPELYDLIRESDRKGVSPGVEKLKELLDACGPCLVLMDELVAYAKKIYGVNGLPAGSYDNFITFIQEITEAARASENSLVVATIPESDIEIGGEAGKIMLETIEHTFGRMEAIWKPVAANEGFEVVRRRLFLDCQNPDARSEICAAFSQMYQENTTDFPLECREVEYRKRMEACYPIHPEVFDRLYEDWATLERFQRTRGVLRLMAAVIHELWMANDAGAMIMPGSIPLDMPHVREELVRHVPETWNSIIDREVDGRNSIPYQMDQPGTRYGKILAARRVARTIMLGSAPTSRAQAVRGLEASHIRLGVVQPEESIALFNDALNTLRNSLAYLYSNANGTRFWYDTRPTLRKTAEDRASQVSVEEQDEEIEARLKKVRQEPPFAGRHPCPASSLDVPDEQAARIVILKPACVYNRKSAQNRALAAAEDILNNRGTAPRIYKNMLVFIAPDADELRTLRTEVSRLIAWRSIQQDAEDLNLDGNQIREAQNSVAQYDRSVDGCIGRTYSWLLVPSVDEDQEMKPLQWEISRLGGDEESMVAKAARKMLQDEQIITTWAPAMLLMQLNELLWTNSNDISVKNLWDQLSMRCYLPRLSRYSVLEDAIRNGVASGEYYALAGAYSDGKYIDLRYGETPFAVNLSDLLVKIEVAKKQKEPEQETEKSHSGTDTDNTRAGGSGQDANRFPRQGGEHTPDMPKEPANTRFYMCANLNPTRINRDVDEYVVEIIRHLTEISGGKAQLTLDVQVEVPDGIPASVVRTVTENCKALNVRDYNFDK